MGKYQKAVYAGTFDPITNGHIDIARRGAALFDQVIVAVAEDNYKSNLFTTEERCALASEALSGVDNILVMPFRGLLVDFCRRQGANFIIRGLRAVSDFDLEFQMALLNRSLSQDIDSVFLMSAEKYLYISSSIIRNTVAAGGDVSHLVPECVYQAMTAHKDRLHR
ncbi:MAG: pantetheine-phosphate adenylyltransferase [Firmicutes bacterium]|nr:pantetheine-phosphate adenylyltransferase [Bacillota bacterium]